MSDKKFPKELLTASAETKKKYWKEEVIIPHPNFNDALNIILDYVKKPTPPIIVVRGPAGAGKTKLAEVTAKKICSQYDLNKDLNHIPTVYYKVLNFSKGNHDWRVTFINLLQAMGEPLIAHKVCYHEEKSLFNLLKGDAKFGIALINALKYRQTKALILDEAHHISKIAGARKIQDQLDVLKILADLSNTKIILFGNYELNVFLDLNDQIIRREKTINFMRYILNKDGDTKKFKSVLNSIQLLLVSYI